MSTPPVARRAFIRGAAVVLTASAGARAKVLPSAEGGFAFEIRRGDAEWRARLSDMGYGIPRAGGTEEPKTGDLWQIYEPGAFHCRGCDLKVYDHAHRLDWTKGWVFFQHAEPNAVIWVSTASHRPPMAVRACVRAQPSSKPIVADVGRIWAHMLMLNLIVVHCIKGIALTFGPAPV
ncbi:MAG: peptide-methionine (R)-S-oxide reductase [Pseudomonadota bacterium]